MKEKMRIKRVTRASKVNSHTQLTVNNAFGCSHYLCAGALLRPDHYKYMSPEALSTPHVGIADTHDMYTLSEHHSFTFVL